MGIGETSGDIGKLRAYLLLVKDLWSTFGLPTIILILLFLMWIGTLPSPFSEAKETMDHMKASLEKHTEHDTEIIFYLKQSCLTNAKLAGSPPDTCIWRGTN